MNFTNQAQKAQHINHLYDSMHRINKKMQSGDYDPKNFCINRAKQTLKNLKSEIIAAEKQSIQPSLLKAQK